MEALPEVLQAVISSALTSGKKMSWNIWNDGEITGVKLIWKPEKANFPTLLEIPPRSEEQEH